MTMMDMPLTPLHFLERAGTLFHHKEVVTREGDRVRRHAWGEVLERTRRLGAAVRALGVRPGERVASLAWNHHRHLELYFGVPGSGAVLLTVNVRLGAEQIAHILAHADAVAVFADPEFVETVDQIAERVPELRHRIVLGETARGDWTGYEDLLARGDPAAPFATVAEQDEAGLCYTSGTTGEPKGVIYTHRALALHTMAVALPDGFGLGEPDVILPAVPMFHANAWGLVHAAAMTGATLVLPGARADAARVADLMADEAVTFAAGVPTVWMGVLDELRARPRPLARGLRIHSGGAPTAPALLRAYGDELGVEILTGWGMTELTPVGMVTHPRGAMATWSDAELLEVRTTQGTPLPFVEVRIVDERGAAVPQDGRTPGELEVRGPWVTAGYFRSKVRDAFRDGWLRTGDVATMDAHGYVRLVDRTKDLIRSGGEWIPSVALEHGLMANPEVVEAAVVAVPDPKWQERPWACVVLRPGVETSDASLLGPLAEHFPRWWVPDGVERLDSLPRTATGKFDKKALRAWLSSREPGG